MWECRPLNSLGEGVHQSVHAYSLLLGSKRHEFNHSAGKAEHYPRQGYRLREVCAFLGNAEDGTLPFGTQVAPQRPHSPEL